MAGRIIVQDTNNTELVLSFLLEEFSRVFGCEIMTNENCIVYNDPCSKYPMLITNIAPVHIRLSQNDLNAISQTIYQLSHELCHYAIRQRKANKSFTLSWFEEIVCEAASCML